MFLRIEELVLASSGADAFEVAYALVAARLYAQRFRAGALTSDRAGIAKLIALARRKWPLLDVQEELALPDATLSTVLDLLDRAGLGGDAEGIDALFEQLVTRVGKGHKGQFFTPRHVVDFATRALGLTDGERFVDPACGSGAFAFHARARAAVVARGYDIDARAVRVARLVAVATGGEPGAFAHVDSLSMAALAHAGSADVVATNPPFAGVTATAGFEVATLGRARVERDALFLERCLAWLVPGGRLAIVLPHGKVASPGWARLRAWLVERARVYAVLSLPAETFLPHTAMKTALLFAKKRAPEERPSPGERVFFGVSERAGVDASGEPLFVSKPGTTDASWRDRDHDLASLARPLHAFLARERFAPMAALPRRNPKDPVGEHAVRTLGELDRNVTLAPERHRPTDEARGVALSELVVESKASLVPRPGDRSVVLDTTHVREGVIDLPLTSRRRSAQVEPTRENRKTRVPVGALLISRLRPYLRQVAFVSASLSKTMGSAGLVLACSPEFSVLVARDEGESLAFLVPYLLSAAVQARLVAGQEGGHRPRVPRETLMAIRVPYEEVRRRRATSASVDGALEALYAARSRWQKIARRQRGRRGASGPSRV